MTQQSRIHNGKFGELPIRTYKTLVGSTDNVLDQDLAEATERLQEDCGDILSKFSDPGPIIDCVLALKPEGTPAGQKSGKSSDESLFGGVPGGKKENPGLKTKIFFLYPFCDLALLNQFRFLGVIF